MSAQLEATLKTFRKWLYLPDPTPLWAMLGTLAANRLPGDPVWLLLVGPPGSGKTEILQSAGELPDVYPAATLTEASLLSGSPRKEHSKDATGGLLRQIGKRGIVLAKDFGSVLNMHADTRASLLAGLREIFDGSWTRHVGTDGGRTLHWEGHVGFVAGCTQSIDRHHAVIGAMGERFILVRLTEPEPDEHARRSIAHAGHEEKMRAELAAAVVDVLQRPLDVPDALEDEERERLIALAVFVVRCRSAVERDGRTRDIELIPSPEAPTRLVIQLARLLSGLKAIGLPEKEAWNVLTRASLDSIPAIRVDVLRVLRSRGELSETQVATETGYPRTTAQRALEDLAAHKVVTYFKQGKGSPTIWSLSKWTRERLEGCPEISLAIAARGCPEKSGATYIDDKERTDKSGQLPIEAANRDGMGVLT